MCLPLLGMLTFIRRLIILQRMALLSALSLVASHLSCPWQGSFSASNSGIVDRNVASTKLDFPLSLYVMSKCVSDWEQKGRLGTGHSRARHFDNVFAFLL